VLKRKSTIVRFRCYACLSVLFTLIVACSGESVPDDFYGDTGDTSPVDTGDTSPVDTGDTSPIDTGDTGGEEVEASFCAASGDIEASGDGWIVLGEKYSLYAETSNAEALVLSAILESGWKAMEDWFGSAPNIATGEKLKVKLYDDVTSWEQAIVADGLAVPQNAGGMYHPDTRTAYLRQQPTVYYTRQLLLHEAIHQFHDLARSRGHSLPGWYAEGHAEHLSLYDWDGECVRLGRLPLLSFDDTPAKALAAGSLDLDNHMASAQTLNRPLEWAMFRFFETADDGAYASDWSDFRDYMDSGGTDAVGEFSSIFGRSPGSFNEEIFDWIANEQQPMTPTYLEWAHVDSTTIDGWADVVTFSQLKEGAERFSMRFEPQSSGYWSGGMVLSFDDSANYTAILVSSDGWTSTFEVDEGSAYWWNQEQAPAAINGGYDFEVVHQNGSSIITINDRELVLPLRFAGSGGLALSGSSLRFQSISWQ
jgi:hypothetical protein